MKHISLKQWARSEWGSVLLIAGLSLAFLFGIAGAGYDLGRQQLVRQKIQQACDAAALAAASMPDSTTPVDRQTMALRYFALNYPDTYMGVPRSSLMPTVTVNANDVRVFLGTPASIATSFVSNLGITALDATGSSQVQINKTANKIDLILVMDNSGSMAADDAGSSAGGPTRLGALLHSADYVSRLLLNSGARNNYIATVRWTDILAGYSDFDNSYPHVRSVLSTMSAFGGTNSTIGLSKARQMARSFRDGSVRAVILLTDGSNNIPSLENPASLQICNDLKAPTNLGGPGALVYTIAFGADAANSPDVITPFLSACATGGTPLGTPQTNLGTYFFLAPDAASLQAAFNEIAGNLQRIRIVN